ncbi:enoyl-CoA hydratase/isomerase family protein [Mycobacterium arosiense]|nr:enoyl-CoA hydratase/isomerase family protein [Mycobacterium arosiense]
MSNSTDLYSQFCALRCSYVEPGVLEIVLQGAGLNAVDAQMHRDLARVWRVVDEDPRASVIVVRGAGAGFCAGAQFDLLEEMAANFATRTRLLREARDLVYNLIDCSKPVISALHGPVVGAGLAVAVLADISIAGRNARLLDGHTRLGVAAGDHAVISWPILAGMAKAKYYLLTNEFLSGAEAERIGLVSLAVDDEEVVPTAMQVARRVLAQGPDATRWTKQSLNHWFRLMGAAFDASLALEFYGFAGPDLKEGLAALRHGRAPQWSAAPGADELRQ